MAKIVLKIAGLFYLIHGVSFVPGFVRLLCLDCPLDNRLLGLIHEACTIALFCSVGLVLIFKASRLLRWLGIVDADDTKWSYLPCTFRQLLLLLGIYFVIESSAGLVAFMASLVRLWPRRITYTAFMSYPEALPPAIKCILGLCLIFASSKIEKFLGFSDSNDPAPSSLESKTEKDKEI